MLTSATTGAIAAALAKAQGAIRNPHKDANNPYFKSKYAPLDTVVEAIRGAMAASELAYVQSVTCAGNRVSVVTRVLHSSGEWLETDPLAADAKDASPQAVGSATTYLRRYSLMAAVGLAPTDEDDDGEASSVRPTPIEPSRKPSPRIPPTSDARKQDIAVRLGRAGVATDQIPARIGEWLGVPVVKGMEFSETQWCECNAKLFEMDLNK